MRFRSYNELKVFDVVARHLSFTVAASELNQSKGSVSYQITKLERELGFDVFHRDHPNIRLTQKGQQLWHASQAALGQLDRIIAELRGHEQGSLTIGVLTYFSSRWLSPRLMDFMENNPEIAIRIEPLNSIDDLVGRETDIAILWGDGSWREVKSQLLFRCPAVPTANPSVAVQVKEIGIDRAVTIYPLLTDSSGDTGWKEWHRLAGLPYRPRRDELTLPDSSSRVQAVIDGQGIALWDELVDAEIKSGRLTFITDIRLEDYGYYLVHPRGRLSSAAATVFSDWILNLANAED